MLKKYLSYLGIFILALFSFYYTDRATDIVKRNDPIMKKIYKDKDKYSVEYVNAILNDDEIIPGINGIGVNVNKSYHEMKKNNNYDPDMYVFKEISPSISFLNDYSKYIVSGNQLKNKVSLVFKINDYSYLSELINILDEKDVKATMFIDGSILENNTEKILELSHDGYELENLGYDGNYSLDKFSWTNNLLSSITNINPKYCYTDYKVKEVLDLCSDYNMYTVKPTISITNYPFITIKHNLTTNFKEENLIQKGYELVNLNDLLTENVEK